MSVPRGLFDASAYYPGWFDPLADGGSWFGRSLGGAPVSVSPTGTLALTSSLVGGTANAGVYPFLLVDGPVGHLPLAGWQSAITSVSVSALLIAEGTTASGLTVSVARPAVLIATTTETAGQDISVARPALLEGAPALTAGRSSSVSQSGVISSTSALLGGQTTSVSRPGTLEALTSKTAGYLIDVLVTPAALQALTELSGGFYTPTNVSISGQIGANGELEGGAFIGILFGEFPGLISATPALSVETASVDFEVESATMLMDVLSRTPIWIIESETPLYDFISVAPQRTDLLH